MDRKCIAFNSPTSPKQAFRARDRLPGATKRPRLVSQRLVCEKSGLGVKGVSFAPLLGNPGRPWKQTAFSQSRRQALGIGPVMGYSMRIECCRLTLWLTRDAGEEVDAELFDYEKDPAETDNLDKSTAHAKVVADLRAPFARGWRGAVPVRR